MKKKMRRLLLLTSIIGLMSLTGCSKAVTLTNPEQAMSEVVERNINVLDEFRLQGLISDAQYNNYNASLRARASTYAELISSAKEATSEDDENFKATLAMLKNSLVNRLGESDGGGGYYGNVYDSTYCEDCNRTYTYFKSQENEISKDEFSNLIIGSTKEKTSMNGRGDEAEPLVFIDENNIDSLLKEINRQVYVLDESKIKTDDDLRNCLEALYNVRKAEMNGNGGDDENYKKLKQVVIKYFKPTDHTVYNFTKEDLIKVSEDNSDNLGSTSGGNSINKDVIINGLLTLTKHNHTEDSDGSIKCETSEVTESVGVYSLRVQEFNNDLYQRIKEQEATSSKYIALQPSSGDDVGVALLMEYPVAVIDSLESDGADKADWHFNFVESDMSINIYSGEMLVRKEDGSAEIINNDEKATDRLYRVFPANAGLDTDEGRNSSFAVLGETDIKVSEITMKDSLEESPAEATVESEETITTVQFALKDYLELTYMPNVVADENFVATGRRITITDFSGSGDEPCGHYTDKLGDAIVLNSSEIKVKPSDIVGYESGDNAYYEEVAKVLSFTGMKNKEEVNEELSKDKDKRAEKLKDVLVSEAVVSNHAQDVMTTDKKLLNYDVYYEKITPILCFTSDADEEKEMPSLDRVDVDNAEIAPASYYGLCVDTNAFATGLYQHWIDVRGDGENIGSLNWWNEWLYDHNYNYHVEIERLKDSMSKVYAVSLSELDGTIVLDLETITIINRDIVEKHIINLNKLLVTVRVLLGALFTVYGMVLLACWIIDVNLVNGPGLLTIASLGRFVAMRDASEIPRISEGKVYVDFKYLMMVMLLLMMLGIVLIVVDFSSIRSVVNGLLDGIVELFRNLMLNRR